MGLRVRGLAAALVVATATAAPADTVVLTTTADSYVSSATPEISYWNSPTLLVIGDDVGGVYAEAYVEFVLPAGTVESATLTLDRDDMGPAVLIEISRVSSGVDVDAVTWNTRPPPGEVVATGPVVPGSNAIALDATNFPSDQPIVLRLRTTLGDCSIISHEGGLNPPGLEVGTGGGIANRCAFDPAERDESNVGVVYRDKEMLFPWKVDYDTGFHPAEFPSGTSSLLKFKAFFYASAGEKDIKTVGDLNASWVAADAVPGNTVDVDVKFIGDQQKSDWTTAFGIKGGVRYKLNVEAGKWWYRKEDYVPKLPSIRRLGFGCIHESFLPPAFDSYYDVCGQSIWGAADLDCFVTVPDVTVNCQDNTNIPLPTLEWKLLFTSLGKPDTTGGKLCTPGIRVHPSAKIFFCIKPSLCVGFNYEGIQLVEESTPDSTNSDNTPLTAPVQIPCDFAQARDESNGPQYFNFTLGPFRMDANWLMTLWAKWEPAIKAQFVEALQLTVGIGTAICTRILPVGSLLVTSVPISFNKSEATFAMKIVEPEVCDIEPGWGFSVTALDSVIVRWKTTWGAPDGCNCLVRLDYHTRLPGTKLWGPWIRMHAQEDIPNDGEHKWMFVEACQVAQIRVEFRDPNSQPLHVLTGGPFLITPAQVHVNPYEIVLGQVDVGEHVDQDVSITNTGDAVLPLLIESPCPPEFTIVSNGGAYDLPPHQSRTFTVRFEPTSPEGVTCNIMTGACPVFVSGNIDTTTTAVRPEPKLEYALSLSYPNPFNPTTTIHYSIKQPGHVSLLIYDVKGRLVKTLVDQYRPAIPGGYSVVWDGTNNRGLPVASGVYFYRVVSGPFAETRKMVLLK